MGFLTKKCEVCGNEINKLQKFRNIYLLQAGEILECENCKTKYKVNIFISILGNLYIWGGAWLFSLLFITIFVGNLNIVDFGLEVWLYAFIIHTIIEFIIMGILPLKKYNKKD